MVYLDHINQRKIEVTNKIKKQVGVDFAYGAAI